MSVIVSICQSNYIPWKGYFDLIKSSDIFVIYDHVQYTKNDWRNRNLIKSNQGLQWLTIPVSQNKLGQKINEWVPNSYDRKHSYDLGNLEEGLYFIRLLGKNDWVTTKVFSKVN